MRLLIFNIRLMRRARKARRGIDPIFRGSRTKAMAALLSLHAEPTGGAHRLVAQSA